MKNAYYVILGTLLALTTACSHWGPSAKTTQPVVNRIPAASISSCKEKITEQYRCAYESLAEYKLIDGSADCKQLSDRVVFLAADGRTVRSVGEHCQTSHYTFRSGYIADYAVFADRLFVVLDSNRIAFVGLDNNLYELLTSKATKANRDSYKRVNGIKIENNVMVLSQDGGGDIRLTVDQVNKRIAEKKYDPITFN